MQCPKCRKGDTKVIDSRPEREGRSIRRRRECERCEFRFSTVERVSTGNILVRKANSTLENFSSEKLEKSIFVACGKRPISQNQIRKIVQELAENWSGQAEVRSSEIGSMVMKELKQLDHIAYIRFASVYRQFKDIEEFKEEIAKLFRISEKGRSHITTDL